MPQNRLNSTLMKPLVALAVPGMYLFYKYNQYKRHQHEATKRRVTEKELQHLNVKIDKLLHKLDTHGPETARTEDEECVVCLVAKATMQTYPCGHRVLCRTCFVKTIQVAVSQRCLPLRCVICRARVLKLEQPLALFDSHQALAMPSPGLITRGMSGQTPDKTLISLKTRRRPLATDKVAPMSPRPPKVMDSGPPVVKSKTKQEVLTLRQNTFTWDYKQNSQTITKQDRTSSPADISRPKPNNRLVRKLQKSTTISHTSYAGMDSPNIHRMCPLTPEIRIRKEGSSVAL